MSSPPPAPSLNHPFLDALRAELRTQADPRRVVAITARLLGQHLEAAQAGWGDVDAGGTHLDLLEVWCDPGAERPAQRWCLQDIGDAFLAELQAGRSVVVDDVLTQAREQAPTTARAFAGIGVRSLLAVPLMRGGALRGLLFALHPQPRQWTPHQITAAEVACERLWAVLQQARAEAQRQASDALAAQRQAELELISRNLPQLLAAEQAARASAEVEREKAQAARAAAEAARESAQAAQAAADQAMAELRAADTRKDDFLAMLAHELRNPLASIRNAVALLQAAQVPATARATDVLDRQSAHLARLLDDLLDVSRVARGKVVLQRGLHDVHAIVQAAVETARPLIEARHQTLTLTLTPAGDSFVYGDLARLVQAVGNVVSNAAKYTPEGGRIAVRLAREAPAAHTLLIEVHDNGIGIAADMLPRVFDLFTQANNSLERSGGLGIGLALVRQMVELHGGSVQAESAGLDQGSCFTLRLPLAAPPAATAAVTQGNAAVAGLAAQAPRRRVLIVDDSRDAAETLGMLLELEGHEVHLCHSGADGRDRAAAERFDVLLLDLGMPGMDGLAVARAVRSGGASQRALLIACTGYGQPEDRARTKDAGFDVHLVKPLVAKELLECLHSGGPASFEGAIGQRLHHPTMQRFHDTWRELRPAPGGQRWPTLAAFLQATDSVGAHRAVAAVLAHEPAFSMRFVSIGPALAQLLPQSLVGQPLPGDGSSAGSLEAAYRQVAVSGEPAHDRVELDFGDGEGLRFERLVVPVCEDDYSSRPTHLISLVVFAGDALPLLAKPSRG